MAEDKRHTVWQVVGTSVRGAAHIRAGLPKQDAIAWLPATEDSLSLAVAVSDGHGSAKCFRSDVGARLAVDTALQAVQDFLSGQTEEETLSASKRKAEERLPQELVRRWQEAVADALMNTPLAAEELEGLEKKDGTAARQIVETNPRIAYGATLLTVLVTQSFLLYLQLGDGDILTVSETGEVSRPLLGDERLFANETTSLCAAHAWRDMRVGFQALSGLPPALILLSTDGYANSFRDDSGFLKVGSDLLDIIRADGLEKVNESLETWLTEASQAGSGDDVTLGIMCRKDALKSDTVFRPAEEER